MGGRSGFRIWMVIGVVLLIIGGVYGGLLLLRQCNATGDIQSQVEFGEVPFVADEYRLGLDQFVERHFMEDGFFRTNLLDHEQTELASGGDVLSESVGLLMLYSIEADKPELFERQVEILETDFAKENQLFQWRIRPGNINAINDNQTVNATLDDLRIVRALLLVADKWKREEYSVFARKISEQLLEYCVVDNQLKAFDDSASSAAPMVYYDFLTMQMLSEFDDRWQDIIQANCDRIIRSQVNGYPFYDDPWFAANALQSSEPKGYPMIENLMVLMHLSEIGKAEGQGLQWLQEQIKHGGIYGNYDSSGKALNSVESPAIYAIVSYIALLHQDEQLYRLALEKLQAMQNMQQGDYYGGFIDLSQLSAYSFDQLTALLAYSREHRRFSDK